MVISANSLLPQTGSSMLLQHRDLVGSIALGELWQMLGNVAVDHVLDPQGLPQVILHRKRILAFVDGVAELLGPLARDGHAPLW